MPALPLLSRERVLNIVPRLAAHRTRLKCISKRAITRLAADLMSGDLIFFVSTRKNLDVFHAGIIVRDIAGVLMRHASRSQGSVVDQDLSEFVKANRMTGVIVMRPQEASHTSQLAAKRARLSVLRVQSSQRRYGAKRRSGT